MKVFITGITGFVGSHLADYILKHQNGVRIVGLARWRSPRDNIKHILDSLILEYADITDAHSIRKALEVHKPDIIFHLAAQSYVDTSFIYPVSTLEVNIVGTCNLLEAVKELRLQGGYDPIVHVCSSSEVYGQVKESELPITEENALRPASP